MDPGLIIVNHCPGKLKILLTFADEEKFSILNAGPGVALDVLDVVFVNIFGVVDESVFLSFMLMLIIDVNVYANVGFSREFA